MHPRGADLDALVALSFSRRLDLVDRLNVRTALIGKAHVSGYFTRVSDEGVPVAAAAPAMRARRLRSAPARPLVTLRTAPCGCRRAPVRSRSAHRAPPRR